MSAEIIRFPKVSNEDVGGRSDPRIKSGDGHDGERLRRALQSLEQALDEQLTAVNAWRASLGELQQTMAGLGASVRRYDGRLALLGCRVGVLHGQARRLEATADAALLRLQAE